MNRQEFNQLKVGDDIIIPPRLEVRKVLAITGENIVYAINEEPFSDKYYNIVTSSNQSVKGEYVLSPLQHELVLKLLEEKVVKNFFTENPPKKRKLHRIKPLSDLRLYVEFSGYSKKSGVIPAYKIKGLMFQEWGQDIFDRAYIDRKDGCLTWFIIHTSQDGYIHEKKTYKVSPEQLWPLLV